MKSRWGRTALDDARKHNKQPRIMDKRAVVAFLEDVGQVAAERTKGAGYKQGVLLAQHKHDVGSQCYTILSAVSSLLA